MFQNYSYECSIVLKEAEKICLSLQYHYVGTEHVLLALLKINKEIKELLGNYNVTYNNFKNNLLKRIKVECKDRSVIYTPMLKSALLLSAYEASKNKNEEINCYYLLWSILENDNSLAVKVLQKMKVNTLKLCDNAYAKINKMSKKDNLEVYELGYSMIDKDYSKCIVNRENELLKIMATLLKKEKPNPLLVGKAGVGKTAIVEELARRIKNKEVPEELYDLEIISVEVSSLVAGTKYRGEFEERMQKVLKELTNTNNIVLFIDEIHSLVSAGGAEGAIKASDILKPYLARGNIRVIGATTNEEYQEYILKDKALNRRFDVINIEEPTINDMNIIMESVVKEYESHYSITIPKQRIKDLILYSDKYLFNKNNPDKTINLLDTVCSKIKVRKIDSIDKKIIRDMEMKKKELLKENNFVEALKIVKLINKYKLNSKKIMTKKDICETIEQVTNIKIGNYSKKDKLLIEKNIVNNTKILSNNINDIMFELSNNTHKILKFSKYEDVINDIKMIGTILDRHVILIDLEDCSITNLIGKWGINEDDYILKELMIYPSSIIVFNNYDKVDKSLEKLINKAVKELSFTNYKNDKISLEYSLLIGINNVFVKQKVGFDSVVNNY